MEKVNRFALKEWAAVCEALAHGRQTILLRKGGLADSGGEFQLAHREFWLFPTRFHQDVDQLKPDAVSLLESVTPPTNGSVAISLYAIADETYRLADHDLLERIGEKHILSAETARDRFQYRDEGINVVVVRVLRLETPFVLNEAPHFAGCRSWVDLRNKLPTSGLVPVLSDAHYQAERDAIRGLLQ